MKEFSVIIYSFLLLNIAGCSTIYGVAVEERKASTIAADTKITTTIQARFVEDNDVKALDISPYCYNGNVYLVGEYDKEPQKERAISIAKGVEGVRSVHTYILQKKKGDKCGTANNVEIRGKVDAKLVADKDIWSTNIDVKVVQCNVVLLGIVKSGKEISRAIAHARSVEGVRSVKSYLKSTH
ncbi:MAG TPA: BON domain-containing protein [Syntrophales bacterium]|nr:BON domain-containing protein [Syntrophales bacterium]